jgi:ABC-type bacteriocin/lantibiotic exporter with double-glycine peptidase domain
MSHPRHHPDKGSWTRLRNALDLDPRDVGMILIFALCVGLLSIVAPAAIETLVNTVAFGVLLWPVIALALVMLTLLIISAALKSLQILVSEYLQRRLFVRYAERFSARFSRADVSTFEGRNAGDLANRFFEVSSVQKALAGLLVDGVGILMITLVGLALLSCYHPYLLSFAVVLVVAVIVVTVTLGRGGVSTSIEESYAKFDFAGWLGEIARSPSLFRIGAMQGLALDRARSHTASYIDARKAHFRIVWRQTLFVIFLEAIASTLLLGLGGWLVINRQLTLGQLVASELIVTLVLAALAKSGKHLEAFYDLEASLDKLTVIDSFTLEPVGGEVLLPSLKPLAVQAACPGPAGEISLDAPAGSRIALLGSPGSGKSRFMETLSLLREPEGARVSFDGINSHTLDRQAARKLIANAGRGEVFSGTILENLRAGNEEIHVEEIREALRDAGLAERVDAFPKGMATPLSSTGWPLSTSESVLLGIARAILAKPRLLLLDGTLDLLDPALHSELIARLADPTAPWTLVVATTRSDIAERIGTTVTLP